MPRPYSIDLRKKVLEAVDKKNCLSKKSVKINPKTIYLWRKRREETGDFQSKKLGNAGYNHKITDWNAFAEFAKKHDSIRDG